MWYKIDSNLEEINFNSIINFYLDLIKNNNYQDEMQNFAMNKIDMKIKYYDSMLKFLEEIIRAVSNRTYQIKNAIEWNKFQAGFNW